VATKMKGVESVGIPIKLWLTKVHFPSRHPGTTGGRKEENLERRRKQSWAREEEHNSFRAVLSSTQKPNNRRKGMGGKEEGKGKDRDSDCHA